MYYVTWMGTVHAWICTTIVKLGHSFHAPIHTLAHKQARSRNVVHGRARTVNRGARADVKSGGPGAEP